MALKIRLSRGGAKKRPFYRVVVAEATAPRDGRFIERLGTYNPILPRDHEDRVKLNTDRIQHWLSVGAKPTDRVLRFLDAAGLAKVAGRAWRALARQNARTVGAAQHGGPDAQLALRCERARLHRHGGSRDLAPGRRG